MQNRRKEKMQAYHKSARKTKPKGQLKSSKLFDIYTGKQAPKGASKSKKNISFEAFVRRHVDCAIITKRTYVHAITGEPAPGITKETQQRGHHITLYSWRVRQKYAEFSEILKAGGDLPPAPLWSSYRQQKTQAAAKQKAELAPTYSNFALPIVEASSVAAGPHYSSLTNSEQVEDMFATDGFLAADIDARVLASPAESDLIAQTVTAAGELLPFLSENATEKQGEPDFNFYFSEPGTLPAFSLLSTAPLYAYSAESADVATSSRSGPMSAAEQDSFAQDQSRKIKPSLHSFFKHQASDCVGHASKKAKTRPDVDSAEYGLPVADISTRIGRC